MTLTLHSDGLPVYTGDPHLLQSEQMSVALVAREKMPHALTRPVFQ